MIVADRRRLEKRVPLRLAACGLALLAGQAAHAGEEPAHSAALDEMIIKQAARHGVPEKLVRRVVMRESRYDPRARNHSFWGLMQISYPTAKSMGFHGTPQQLLNPVVNLTYAVPYLANAFVIAGKREDAAVHLYASGYYATAKRRGLLGVLRTADSAPVSGPPDEPPSVTAAPAPSYGVFGALFGPGPQPSQDAPPQMAQAAYTPPTDAQVQTAQASATLPPDNPSEDDVTLTSNEQGVLAPPKKWLRDGGVTVIARGEQSVDEAVANEKAAGSASDKSRKLGHAHKNTTFAALEAPPASAQAYAATAAGAQDPRLTQAASQAAIAEATSGQPPTTSSAAEPTVAQPIEALDVAAAPARVARSEPQKSHGRRLAKPGHRREAAPDKPAAVATAANARGGPPQDSTVEPPAPQASADRNDPGAQQQAEARAADARASDPSATTTDASPARRHHTRHARARKAPEAMASQRVEDNQPPAPAVQAPL